MLTDAERRFLEAQRVARFATAGADGQPHVIPVCYALLDESACFTIDEKPKREARAPLRRLRNLAENPRAALVADRYDEDWSRLAWVMLRGRADVLDGGPEHERAQRRLRERYPQLRAMRIEPLPVVSLRIERATSWGRLDGD